MTKQEKLSCEDLKYQKENEKTDQLVGAFMDQQVDLFLDEFVCKASIEFNHCEFYCDKLLSEEVKNQVRTTVSIVIQEEQADLRLKQKQLMLELKEKIIEEAIESLVDVKVDSMIRECCERVLIEYRKERLESIYKDLLEETLPKLIEKELFQVSDKLFRS